MAIAKNKRETILHKELAAVEKQEQRLKSSALKVKPLSWKGSLEAKIPARVYSGLESAFCKGFAMVFSRGRSLIEKSYKKENIQAEHAIRDYAIQIKGGRKEYRSMRKGAANSGSINLALTTVEGIALGALGIGMPDIVLFLSTLLKSVYETALNYGFDYNSREEQFIILKMMQTALSNGEEWEKLDSQVDELFLKTESHVSEEAFKKQLEYTASSFALDMLLLKFVQGLPVIGVIGGAANPVYHNKIMKYVSLKYRKHYLLKLKHKK